MKKFIGYGMMASAFVFWIGGVFGGIFGALAMLAYSIWDVIQMVQGDIEVTFGSILWVLVCYAGRGILAVFIIGVSWFIGVFLFAVGHEYVWPTPTIAQRFEAMKKRRHPWLR